ncbi:MAG: hypothetical protein B7Z37_04915 [Verrucomicrobia bacterium 12-59-8]|nr:MAG: hypothetical protein B7Z37_04915 [Verrucomicrobia bacterium 12-59-8]
MKYDDFLKKPWLIAAVPMVVFVWNMMFACVKEDAPALLPAPSEGEKQRVVRVYEGLRDLNGEGGEGAPWTSLTISVWVRDFDGWLQKRMDDYPKTMDGGGYMYTALKAYFAKPAGTGKPSPEEKANFNAWMRQSLESMRLNIGGQIFTSLLPDAIVNTTETPPTSAPPDYTWNRLVFRNLIPDKSEAAKLQSLVKSYTSECTAPISLALPVKDSKGDARYVTMQTLVNDGPKGHTQYFSLPLRPRLMRALAWAAMTGVLWVIISVSYQTGVLRAPVPPPPAGGENVIPDWQHSPWSASRVVMAWWLAICTSCYLFLWAMQGSMDVLSGSAPLLLGINGGTLLAASWVTSNQKNRVAPDVPPPLIPHDTFLKDIITEGKEAEIAKLQMVVWNGVLGVVFIWQCLSDWEMPKFSEQLMTLLGISATAYVGYKAQQ